MDLDKENKSISYNDFNDAKSVEPIEAIILQYAGWLGVLISIFAWYFISDTGGYRDSVGQNIYGAIIGISGIIGSLILAGFGRIIILLSEINYKMSPATRSNIQK